MINQVTVMNPKWDIVNGAHSIYHMFLCGWYFSCFNVSHIWMLGDENFYELISRTSFELFEKQFEKNIKGG